MSDYGIKDVGDMARILGGNRNEIIQNGTCAYMSLRPFGLWVQWHLVERAIAVAEAEHAYAERNFWAASRLVNLAGRAFDLLDADEDMKCLKLLKAMGGGSPGYRADIDEIHAVLAKNNGVPRGGEATGSQGQNAEAVKRAGGERVAPLSNEREGHKPPSGESATSERREEESASPVKAADLSREGIESLHPSTSNAECVVEKRAGHDEQSYHDMLANGCCKCGGRGLHADECPIVKARRAAAYPNEAPPCE